jgi:hypothetical protein
VPVAENGLAATVTEALARRYPLDPPRFLARVPHGYADPPLVAGDLATAGFAGAPTITRLGFNSRADSARGSALAHVQGTPLRHEVVQRDPQGLTPLKRPWRPTTHGPREAPILALLVDLAA